MIISYRSGDMHAPQLETAEALETEANHFLRCIEGREVPISGGEAGLQSGEPARSRLELAQATGAARRNQARHGDGMIPFADLRAQYHSIKPEIDQAVP